MQEYRGVTAAVGSNLIGCGAATASSNNAVKSTMKSADNDNVITIMYGNAAELSVQEVKGLRNGFLYIGPHDQIKSWSLPRTNLNELQSKKQVTQEMDSEIRQQTQEGFIIPNIVKLMGQPAISQRWQPHDILSDGLQHQVDIGDVQTAVCILIALGEHRVNLTHDDITHEAWFLSYVELLQRHQLWSEATEIINLSWLYSVRELNQQSTALHTNCGECGRPMNNTAGWLCSRCKSARASDCAVCNCPVRGMYAWCQGCAHGGHLEHMRQWFGDHAKCPKCGHLCEYD